MYFSKSDYLLYKQCPKSFWTYKKNPSLFQDDNQNGKLDKGNEVTELARNLFPNGVLVDFNPNISKMIEKTNELIFNGTTTIYEAAFAYKKAIIICDILHFDGNYWRIYEVKSATKVKERHLDDVAFQLYVAQNNLNIHSTHLVHLNSDYCRGKVLDLHQLFTFVDVTEETIKRGVSISEELKHMNELIESNCPSVEIGVHCLKYGKDDFPCALKEHCWSHIPSYSVFDITRISGKAFELYSKGILSIKDIPDNFKLSDSQKFQVKAFKEGIVIIDKDSIAQFMNGFHYPLYFLDFETFQQSIPLYEGIKPYQQIPFQFSLHVLENKGANLNHKEFLAKEGTDPRRKLAESLIENIPMGVCSIAYNMSFEKMVLRELGIQFPDLREHLMDIHDNMVDLMVPFQKKWFYINEMKGSYSIKYVLPALFPNDDSLNYKRLNIQNGSMAMEIYERLHTFSNDEIQLIRKDLLSYCELDTFAMVKIWGFLSALITAA